VMDGSDTRRHRPTMHRHFADEHLRLGWRGENRRVGEGFAILLGDLAFAYSVRLLSEQPAEVHALFDEMRIELHVGQYLDLFHAADGRPSPEAAREIARFKTAKYSVERPLHMGAALCGASHLSQTFSVFGLAVGEAFQHRDDLLGVFGDPAATGKPSGDDLWAGKQTLLLQECQDHPEACRLGALEKVGTADLDHNHVEAIRCFMVDSGIVAGLERRINELVDLALTSLDGADLCDSTRSGLEAMARTSAWRIS